MILKGKPLADIIKKGIKTKNLHLAVILVGDDPASRIYVKKKIEACVECSIKSTFIELPFATTTEHLLLQINSLNLKKSVHGILVQLPLPKHIDKFRVLNEIDPKKDVDCFTATNLGLLAQNKAMLKPCTPSAIISLLDYYSIPIKNKTITIVNDSIVVGRPLATMLLDCGGTPVVCHQHSPKFDFDSDIVVTAVGKPNYQFSWTHPHQTIIDLGINRIDGKIVGDVVESNSKNIAPAVGGVGPVTVAMLMRNTEIAAQ
jgi:methylenetetrahydrofolate dehydrogenase (NADP+)/methenyltetrahydrofolate cyclohydrolase